jgi:myo-inositol-1(or 4)-monophosphatase
MNLEKICRDTIVAVEKAGEYILEQYNNSSDKKIEEKGKHNFVTKVDKTAEEILVKELLQILPEAGIIAEEGTLEKTEEKFNWIIDPLDGTTNFIHGAFPFAISVGLAENNIPILGVILELGFQECFYAWKDGGAFMNGKAIKVSANNTLNKSLIATGFPYTNFSSLEAFMKTIDWFMKNSRGLRRLGSAATDIAWVACGRYDGFYEYGLQSWDVAAGVIILKEAGGNCSDFSGESDYIFGEEIICSNGKNHNEFIDVVKSFMKN